MPTITIKKVAARHNDLDLVTPLFDAYRQFYGQSSDLNLARQFLEERLRNSESVIYVALDESNGPARAIGFVQLYPLFSSVRVCRVCVLNDLFVIPVVRGTGVGRALMERARMHALESGAKRILLETADDNTAAAALYESLGYRRDDVGIRHYALELV